MKIITVVGARPQFIKAALVSQEIRKAHTEILVHTGQHYDINMSRTFFEELNIPEPDYNLEAGSDTHARQTAGIMVKIEGIYESEKPDMVLVYGDTNSTIAAALTAAKLQIPIAHVEAGPRMNDKSVPEEVNRILTDHISDLLFAPTQTAVNNLNREGINRGVYLTGDVMLDSFNHFRKLNENNFEIMSKHHLESGKYLLATVHRARNTDIRENLQAIVDSLCSIPGKIIFPVHPRTTKYLKQFGLYEKLHESPDIILIEPVGYIESIILTSNAKKVITDSGGLQKEAYFARVPCVTLDESTGWTETVEDNWNVLVGSDKDKILDAVENFVPDREQRNVFGDGKAAEKMVNIMSEFCSNENN